MKNIWLVIGECGEYSDFMGWNVASYTKECDANAHADAAQKHADSLPKNDWDRHADMGNPHDPQYRSDYTGTKYRVEMVELREAFSPSSP